MDRGRQKPNPLRERAQQRKENLELLGKKIQPDTKQFITGRKRYYRRAVANGGPLPAPQISDCRDCPLLSCCEYDHDVLKCPAPSNTIRCQKCGQRVAVFFMPGGPPIHDNYSCPRCNKP